MKNDRKPLESSLLLQNYRGNWIDSFKVPSNSLIGLKKILSFNLNRVLFDPGAAGYQKGNVNTTIYYQECRQFNFFADDIYLDFLFNWQDNQHATVGDNH